MEDADGHLQVQVLQVPVVDVLHLLAHFPFRLPEVHDNCSRPRLQKGQHGACTSAGRDQNGRLRHHLQLQSALAVDPLFFEWLRLSRQSAPACTLLYRAPASWQGGYDQVDPELVGFVRLFASLTAAFGHLDTS